MSNYPEKLTDGYYYVRKTFEDKESQLARYRVLGNAKTKAEDNPGYCVFAEDGTCVYSPVAEETEVEAEQTETEQAENAQTEERPSAEEEVTLGEAVADAVEETTKGAPPESYRLLTLMNVRRQPSLNAEKIGTLPEGTIVLVVAVENDWLHLADGTFVLCDGGRFAEKV